MHRFFVGTNVFENSSTAKIGFRMTTVLYRTIKVHLIFKEIFFPFLIPLIMNLKFLKLKTVFHNKLPFLTNKIYKIIHHLCKYICIFRNNLVSLNFLNTHACTHYLRRKIRLICKLGHNLA